MLITLFVLSVLSLASWIGSISVLVVRNRERQTGVKARWWFPVVLLLTGLLNLGLSVFALITSLVL